MEDKEKLIGDYGKWNGKCPHCLEKAGREEVRKEDSWETVFKCDGCGNYFSRVSQDPMGGIMYDIIKKE